MRIEINQIPAEGLRLSEEFTPKELDLETELIKFRGNILVNAVISKISQVVTATLSVNGLMYANCSRCLEEFTLNLKKDIVLNYPIDKPGSSFDVSPQLAINLNPDIREEIILDYPIKPLCRVNCKGLCAKCGKNLNEEACKCGERREE